FGTLMENAVFIENLRKGFRANLDLFYHKTRTGKKIDFLIKSGINTVQLIQVCYSIDKLETREREIKALIEGGEELSCSDLIIITWDHEELYKFKGKEIKFIPLWKWLLK
ncbi:MAG: ATP-binding protein, partial [Actinobacteria bacterium]|nr:ATP-binding protein [Actinomycetota bacterium]